MVSVSIDVDRVTLGDFRAQMRLIIESRHVNGSDLSLECHTKGELA